MCKRLERFQRFGPNFRQKVQFEKYENKDIPTISPLITDAKTTSTIYWRKNYEESLNWQCNNRNNHKKVQPIAARLSAASSYLDRGLHVVPFLVLTLLLLEDASKCLTILLQLLLFATVDIIILFTWLSFCRKQFVVLSQFIPIAFGTARLHVANKIALIISVATVLALLE